MTTTNSHRLQSIYERTAAHLSYMLDDIEDDARFTELDDRMMAVFAAMGEEA